MHLYLRGLRRLRWLDLGDQDGLRFLCRGLDHLDFRLRRTLHWSGSGIHLRRGRRQNCGRRLRRDRLGRDDPHLLWRRRGWLWGVYEKLACRRLTRRDRLCVDGGVSVPALWGFLRLP